LRVKNKENIENKSRRIMNKNLESLNSFVSDLSNSGVAVYALNRTNEIPRQKIEPLINDCFFKVPG
jgi:hypothetical protein